MVEDGDDEYKGRELTDGRAPASMDSCRGRQEVVGLDNG